MIPHDDFDSKLFPHQLPVNPENTNGRVSGFYDKKRLDSAGNTLPTGACCRDEQGRHSRPLLQMFPD